MVHRSSNSADVASSYINGTTPKVFAENANREAYKIEKGLKGSVSFSLIDDDALQKIMTGNAVEFNAKWKDTFTDPPKIYNWTYSKVQDSVYIGMLKGESMKKVADRIQQVTGSDEATAIRNARTSVISASNQGKMATFERAAKMGINLNDPLKMVHRSSKFRPLALICVFSGFGQIIVNCFVRITAVIGSFTCSENLICMIVCIKWAAPSDYAALLVVPIDPVCRNICLNIKSGFFKLLNCDLSHIDPYLIT